jgi:hypothetical protein
MPDREEFDGLAGLEAIVDAQRRGLEAAAEVVERMLELGRQSARAPFPFYLPAEPLNGGNGDGASGAEEQAREARRLRGDAERLLELLGESMRVVFDVAVGAVESGLNGTGEATDKLVLGPVPPGDSAVASAWLHVLDGPPGSPARLHATALTAHDGAAIESAAFGFEPPLLDTFALRASEEVVVTVRVPGGTAPGSYRGHILAAGLPEVGLPVTVEVCA